MSDFLLLGLSLMCPALILFIILVWSDFIRRKPRRRY